MLNKASSVLNVNLDVNTSDVSLGSHCACVLQDLGCTSKVHYDECGAFRIWSFKITKQFSLHLEQCQKQITVLLFQTASQILNPILN